RAEQRVADGAIEVVRIGVGVFPHRTGVRRRLVADAAREQRERERGDDAQHTGADKGASRRAHWRSSVCRRMRIMRTIAGPSNVESNAGRMHKTSGMVM